MTRAADLATLIVDVNTTEAKTDELTGKSTAGSIAVTAEGNSTTTNLQQGLAKAWCQLTGTGPTINDSFNLASVTDTGVGQRTTVWTNAFSNDDYAMSGGQTSSGGDASNVGIQYHSITTASVNNLTFASGAVVDDTMFGIYLGDLAQMLGHAAIAESAISDEGGALIIATAEMNALATSSNIGVGTLVGVSSMSSNFTKTTAGIFITGSVNAEVSSNFTQTTEDIKIVNFTDVTMSSSFTETVAGISILSGVSSQDLNFTKTSSGDILYVEINSVSLPVGKRPAGAPTPGIGYTEITPTGVETYTEITPSGTETYTEIARQ